MVTYFKTLETVGERMLPVLARSPAMPANFSAPFFRNEAHVNVRFLHYPPQEIDDDEQFGQGPHTDNSFITILARMDVPGLAVRLPSGEWLAPPLIPGTFLVNLGNIMKRWSNDRFLSTPHGVLNDSGLDRYSIAFFYSPNVDAVIECVPSCVGPDDPPRYPPAVYRDLVLRSTVRTTSTRRATPPRDSAGTQVSTLRDIAAKVLTLDVDTAGTVVAPG